MNPFVWPTTVATCVETAVAMTATLVVTVFFVAMAVFPEALHAQMA